MGRYLRVVPSQAIAKKSYDAALQSIVEKCLNGKPKLKVTCGEIVLLYLELECDPEKLIEIITSKAIVAKQPKTVAAAVEIMTSAVSEFGSKCFKKKQLAGLAKA